MHSAAILAACLCLFDADRAGAVPPTEALDGYFVAYDGAHRSVEVIGLFGPGLSELLRRELNAHPETKRVHLSSFGGLVVEGRRVRDLISARQLDTYVRTACVSACTLAFIGGKQRILRRDAVIGFHQYSAFHGEDLREFIQDVDRSYFRGRGVHEEFVGKVYQASHTEIWTPTAEEVVQANFATQVTDRFDAPPPEFFGPETSEAFRQSMGSFARFYPVLQAYEPETYRHAAIMAFEVARSGRASDAAEIVGNLIGSALVVRHLATVSDEAARALARAVASSFTDLRRVRPISCVGIATDDPVASEDWDSLAPATHAQTADAYAAVIRGAHERPQPVPTADGRLRTLATFLLKLARVMDTRDIEFIADTEGMRRDPDRTCRVMGEWFAFLADLPPPEAGAVLRAMAADD